MTLLWDCECCVVRSWKWSDRSSIVRHANNRKIWLNLRDQFPHPYRDSDAREFLRYVRSNKPETHFAIAVGDEAVGGIGFVLGKDVERCGAEIGYWLGEPFWGRGITTAALHVVTHYALQTHQLARVFALPFSRNIASIRVLEKVGFEREGLLRCSAIKDGELLDQVLYAFIKR